MTKLATMLLLIAIAACFDGRVETVTINPMQETDHMRVLKPILDENLRGYGYLDDLVGAFRIRLIIKDSERAGRARPHARA
jgi:hypothetical protein